MKTKIFWGNQHVESFVCDGKSYTKGQLRMLKIRRMIKRILTTSAVTVGVAWVAVGALHFGMAFAPKVYAEKEVVKEVRVKAPIMDKIAKCESGNTHLDPKTGQVLMRGNTNKTVDIGRYQLNSVWHKKATELGLDLTKDADNEKFAYWLFENRGTEDWYSSKSCWAK